MGATLFRYVVKEQLVPMSICLFGSCLVLVTGRLMQLLRYLFASNVTVGDLVELILLAMPNLILYALPMANLVGVLLAFLRFTSDNELVAMRAAGIEFRSFLPPVALVLILSTLISLGIATHVRPRANDLFLVKLRSLGRDALPALLRERTFIRIIPEMTFFFHKIDPVSLALEGIFVEDHREPKIQVAIVAERGQMLVAPGEDAVVFRIANGTITRVTEDYAHSQMVSFIDYELPLRFDELFKSGSGQGKRRIQMTFQELREAIGSGQLDRRSYNLYVMEYHQRLVMPLACLLLGLLGAPVGASAPKANRMAGLTMSLFLFLAYYVGLTAGLGLGKNNLLHPVLAVWLPNAVTLVLAVVLWMRVQRERSIGLPGQGSAFPGRLRRGILSVVRKAARRPSRDPGVRP